MEAAPPSRPAVEDWVEQLDQSLNLQRDRIREFLDAQQGRLQRVETELDRQLQQHADQLAQDREQCRQTGEEVQQRAEQLARETQALEALKEGLAARQAEWEELQERAGRHQEALVEQIRQQQEQLDQRREELAKQQSEIDAAEAKLRHDQRASDLARQEQQAELEQTAALRKRLEAKQVELDTRGEQLAARQAETETQRRRIAREFKAQHAANLEELERRRAELQQRDEREQSELKQQLETDRAQQTECAAELEAVRQREKELEVELKSLRATCDQLRQELPRQSTGSGVDVETLKSVEAERDALLTRLSETESRLAEVQESLAEAREAGAGGESSDDDTRRRYEMVLEDLRELKSQNAELKEQLAQARSVRPATRATGGALNWEAEKQRILAALESDSEGEGEPAKAERLKIKEVVRNTDRMLAEKERECSELKQLLENQSSSLGSVAVGAAALGEMFDSDAIVQEERGKLRELQEQWREKLRQAEIDISIERAKLAREKAEIQEKLHVMENRGDGLADGPGDAVNADKPARGRWLERLGLKDANEK